MRRLLASGIGWIVLLCAADTAGANWTEPSGGSLNADTTLQGDAASIGTAGSAPYVAWEEYDASNRSQIRVRRLEGGTWVAVGGSLNVSTGRDAYSPSVASVGGIPYAAWQEYDGSHFQIRVKRLEAGSWTAVGDSLNFLASQDAETPSITSVGDVPYVAWRESDGTHQQIRVKWFDGLAWQPVGTSLNISPAKNAQFPSITAAAGMPYVAWVEDDGIASQVRVARLEGTAWAPVGGSLNVSPAQDSERPQIGVVSEIPYVTWTEDGATSGSQVYVKRLDGTTWTPVGAALNAVPGSVAGSPALAGAGPTAVVAWAESNGTNSLVYVKRFDGTSWVPLASVPLNVSSTQDAGYPAIASVGGVPYVSWDEYDSPTSRQIRVKRLEPDIVSESATPTATGAALAAQVDDFGLALPIAFEFGTTASFGTATPLQATNGSGISTVTQAIGGLTPLTAYSYRAFGSDSVRQTSLGSTQTFTTLAPPPGVGRITQLRLSPARFVAASTGPSVKAAATRGTVVTYADSQVATTTLTVQRPTQGRRKGAACVKAKKRPPKAKRCTRYVKAGSFSHADTAGPNRFRFTGRVGGRKLKPGAYRLRVVARNSAGAGKPATRRFRIKKR
jgi:hypothetical protein